MIWRSRLRYLLQPRTLFYFLKNFITTLKRGLIGVFLFSFYFRDLARVELLREGVKETNRGFSRLAPEADRLLQITTCQDGVEGEGEGGEGEIEAEAAVGAADLEETVVGVEVRVEVGVEALEVEALGEGRTRDPRTR